MSLEVNNFKITKKKVSKEIEQNLKKYQNIVDGYNKKLVEIQDNINKDNNINTDSKTKKSLIDEDIVNIKKQGLIEDEYTQQQKINYIGKEVHDIENIGNNILVWNDYDYNNHELILLYDNKIVRGNIKDKEEQMNLEFY